MQKIKVMIVDDEILAVEDLRDLIPWEKLGYEIAAQTTDSEEALRLFGLVRPEIVILDIVMPAMNGLELSKKILNIDPSVKIILLTSYSEFEYAKQAIEIGVFNYILKREVNEDKLLKLLEKAKEELYEQKVNHNYLRKQLLRKVLQGKVQLNDNNVNLSFYDDTKNAYISIFLIIPDTPFPVIDDFRFYNNELPDIEDIIINQISYTSNIKYLDSVVVDKSHLVIFFKHHIFFSEKKRNDEFYNIALQIKKKFKEISQSTISIIISHAQKGYEGIHQAYMYAINVSDHMVFFGKDKYIVCEKIIFKKSDEMLNLEEVIDKIDLAVKTSNLKIVLEQINIMFNSIINANWDINILKRACHRLVFILEHYRNDNGMISLYELLSYNKIDTEMWYYVEDIKTWFMEQFKKALDNYNDIQDFRYSSKIKKAIDFIGKNYSKPITAKDICLYLGISEFYLSRLFKKETGLTLTEYLTNYRIEVSKTLLSSGKYKIYEVAEMVGYKNSQYFSHVFKKVTGKNPLNYIR